MKTLIENYKVLNLLPLVDIVSATTTYGTGADCAQMGEDLLVIVSLGSMVGTHTCDVKMQESAVLGSGYGDITGAALTQASEASDNMSASLGFKRTKQFVRVAVVTAGTVTTNQIAVIALVEAEQGNDGLNSKTFA